jgi:signal transduction histidine kinase
VERAALRNGKIELQLDIDEAVEGIASALSELDLARVVHDLVADARQAFAGREGPQTLRVLLALERRTSRSGIALVVESDGWTGPEPPGGAGLPNGPGTGSGHGLAIVRSLVERVSGEVQVGSGSRGDALFRVWIPLARESA